ncbi:MAG: hypothetical protein ACYCW6_16515 [Candidatus Xenobia bacterium]
MGSLTLALAFLSQLEVAWAGSFTQHLAAFRIPLTISFGVLLLALIVVLIMLRNASSGGGGVRLVSVSAAPPSVAPVEPAGDPFKNAMARANAPSSGSLKAAPAPPPTPPQEPEVSYKAGTRSEPAPPPPPAMEDVAPVKEARKPLKVDVGLSPASPVPPAKPAAPPPPPPAAPAARTAATAGKGTDSWKELLQKVAFDGEETSTSRLSKPPTEKPAAPAAPPPPPPPSPPPAPAPPPVAARPMASASSAPSAGKPKDDDPWKSLLKKVKDDQADTATVTPAPPPKKSDDSVDFMPMGDTGALTTPPDKKLEWSEPKTLRSSDPANTGEPPKRLQVQRTSELEGNPSDVPRQSTSSSSTQKIQRKFLELERPGEKGSPTGDSPNP